LTRIRIASDDGGVKGAAVAVLLALLTAGLAAGCTGDEGDKVATSSCGRVLYEGEGKPDVLVVSDFPFTGAAAEYTNTRLTLDAIELVLRQRGFRAGGHRVGYQSCNDTVGNEDFDSSLCRRNAHAYAATDDVVGMIGPLSSGCAALQIPILSRRSAGPLVIVSPANTWAGLTRSVPDTRKSGDALYPDEVRNYVRVVPHDRAQGRAAARLAKRLGARRVVLLEQKGMDDAYVAGLAVPFVEAAEELGLDVSRFAWLRRGSYARLARQVAAARPDAVFLAGLTQGNAKRLVEELRDELGSTPLIAPDSFASAVVAAELGRPGEGLYVTEAGIPWDSLPAAGKRFLRAFGRPSVDVEQSYAVEAAQATEILLDAIGRSDGTRASVVEEVFATRVENGILGSLAFDRFGDVVPTPVRIFRIRDRKLVAET
jgi:branched-chain amino acid transport system substrate-binding protein